LWQKNSQNPKKLNNLNALNDLKKQITELLN